jgi:hypothetical protein
MLKVNYSGIPTVATKHDKLLKWNSALMKVDSETLKKVIALYNEYKVEVEASDLKPLTKRMYLTHCWNFIRWMEDSFKPGSKNTT